MQPTPKIMFVCSHLIGRVRATTELARRLTAAGYEVSLAVPPKVKAQIQGNGMQIFEIAPVDLGGVHAGKKSNFADFLPHARRQRLAGLRITLDLQVFETLIAAEAPTLIVIDAEMHPHIVTALASSSRVTLLSDLFLSKPSAFAPPLDSNLIPGRDSRAKIRWAWVRLWAKWRRVQFRLWLSTAGTDYLSLLRWMARERGVDWTGHTTRWWWQVPVAWSALPLLIMQGQPLDFPMEHERRIQHLGPMVPALPPLTSQDEMLLDTARAAKTQSKRVVYIASGASFKANEKTVRTIWDAIRNREDLLVIQSTGGRADFVMDDAPENVVVVDWAPQAHLLKLCDAAVIHAGVNTVLECLAGGTPMLAIPARIDQPGNAARIAYHGLGRVCTRIKPAEIANALHDILNDPSYTERCIEMQRALDAFAQDKIAETVFSELINQKPR